MIPAAFDYAVPATVEEALKLLRKNPEAKVMAGGQSLLSLMKLRLATPPLIVDLRRIRDLSYIREDGSRVLIGAMTTHAEIERSPIIRRRFPVLAQAAEAIGDLQVRNMGTIGGSLAHADPAADYPAAFLAMEGAVQVQGPRKARTILAEDFFTGLYTTALNSGEIITEIQIPIPPAVTGSAYRKMKHPASGFAVVGAAAVLRVGPDGREQRLRLAFTGAAAHAIRATAVEMALRGKAITEQAIAEAMQHATDGVEMLEDLFADREYRAQLVRVYGKRAVMAALQ
ncbi:MAG: xanthine dehydrogenase family protein subunit M [Armatimonadetes bacterium]|nr:xanthine dehydrogenase family protein subunit M [Armatimonadota bacterium]